MICSIEFAAYNAHTEQCVLHCACGEECAGDSWQDAGALMDEHLSIDEVEEDDI